MVLSGRGRRWQTAQRVDRGAVDQMGTMPADATTRPSGPLHFAGMAGLSIAARSASPWITDFLNAAYFRRTPEERDVADLRLAFGVVTTVWHRRAGGRRLDAADLPAFHAAYGRERFATDRSARGLLTHEQLLEGAERLLGPWFPDAWADDGRRGWGIAFESAQERAAHDPSVRLALARLEALTPGEAPPGRQVWHTYDPVRMPGADATLAALLDPPAWPDFASDLGRFTPLRPGGLAGQTFEIEVAAGTDAGRPLYTRGYVTVTTLVSREDPAALADWCAALQEGMTRHGDGEQVVLPDGATPVAGLDLTTHRGHFMGAGRNRLLVYEHAGATWARAAGTWDPMAWHLDRAYERTGRVAQAAFWSGADPSRNMLLQLAAYAGARA
jgi:hypothetical protein